MFAHFWETGVPVLDTRLDVQIRFQHRFFQAVLGSLTNRCKSALDAAKRGRGGLPDDMPLSRTQIAALQKWHRRFHRNLAINVTDDQVPHKLWMESVPALIETVSRWDNTLLGEDRLRRLFEEDTQSTLAPAIKAVGNPDGCQRSSIWTPVCDDGRT